MKRSLKEIVINERGFSLIEVLATLILLAFSLSSLFYFIQQNFVVIERNKIQEQAIFVREDIKEWMTYRAQAQDIISLNPIISQVNVKTFLQPAYIERMNHLILDETGIQRDSETGRALYEEVERDSLEGGRGQIVSKVIYDLSDDSLPKILRSDPYNKFYIGEYINSEKSRSGILVKIKIKSKEDIDDYIPQVDGVDVSIIIYSKKTGELLTETWLHWVGVD